jgi:SAM-dependent methyltransferase
VNITVTNQGNILSVGCGSRQKEPRVIRLDISPEVNPDVVWNLNNFPYPFDESSFSYIECFDVIKHLDDIIPLMDKYYRLLTPEGVLKLVLLIFLPLILT